MEYYIMDISAFLLPAVLIPLMSFPDWRHSSQDMLGKACCLLDEKPDSALAILDYIPVDSLDRDRRQNSHCYTPWHWTRISSTSETTV